MLAVGNDYPVSSSPDGHLAGPVPQLTVAAVLAVDNDYPVSSSPDGYLAGPVPQLTVAAADPCCWQSLA